MSRNCHLVQLAVLTRQHTTARVAGHFGEWIQGRLGPDGPLALITVPCPVLSVEATWKPAPEIGLKWNGHRSLSLEQAKRMLMELDLGSGAATFNTNMISARGTGASTAALVALAQAAGVWDPLRIAQACVAVEGASDPLMLAHPDEVLWAPRRADSLRELPKPPEFEMVGGFFGADQMTDPADTDFPDVGDLVDPWTTAASGGNRHALAECATASAQRTTALRGPVDDPTADLSRALGALGWVRAHTGSARALVFAPGSVPRRAKDCLAEAGLRDLVQFETRSHA